ncbi:MAG: hypothetical protein J0L80_02350 [Chitinophagales bacterium]|nr:hypothetical protein [Chitinophagales bacterium]
MATASELWRERESPLWLLLVSRSKAQHPSRHHIAYDDVVVYVSQFSQGLLPDIKDHKFLDKIHAGHQEFLNLLAKEAESYYRVFYDQHADPYDSYTIELVNQFNAAYAPLHTMKLYDWQIYENPQVVGNMMIAIAMAAIRDMALVEELARKGELNKEEHDFALKEINSCMDRVGINGVDRLFESKPELEEFIQHDIRVIKVGHMTGQAWNAEKTRAAAYNVEKLRCAQFNSSAWILSRVRQDIIDPRFKALGTEKDHQIAVHVHELTEPSDEERSRHISNGKIKGLNSSTTLGDLKNISKNMSEYFFHDKDKFANFLIHDGIAINHPQRNTYAAKIRHQMKEVKQPKFKVVHPEEKLDAVDATPKDENTTNALVLASEPKPTLPQRNTANIEDAEIIEETQNPVDPKKKDEVVDAEIIDDGGHSIADASKNAKPPTNAATKVATLVGAAALAGLAFSGTTSNHKDGSRDRSSESRTNKRNPLKPIAFATATVVAVGGAIMWSKKPEFLHKPLKELIEKVLYGIART